MLISPKKITLKNSQEVILRSPSPDDSETLLGHLKNLLHQSYRNLNHPKNYWDNFPIEEEKKTLTDFASSKEKFIISAFNDNRIVGHIGVFGFGGEFLKHNARIGMGLQNDFHNLGLGTALLQYAFASAKEQGFRRLELTVRTFNQPGIALYEKVGFRKIGILKETAYIDGKFLDEYLYEILLG